MSTIGRRTLIRVSAGACLLKAFSPGALFSRPATQSLSDPADLTLTEVSQRVHSGKLTSVQLTQSLLERISIFNPKVNAYITVMSKRALAQAALLDAEAQQGKFRGPLHGVPIAVKDTIDTAGVRTTAASAIFDDRVPNEDAEVVRLLKLAGAVIIGKTNMHEFAADDTSASTYFGPVRNPWALDHNPGGSSGGSGAAVCAGLCFGALGTDTGGSIRTPASYCGIVGLKPTFGLVSLRGIIPCVYSLDHCGPMAKTTEDAAMMLSALVGYDKNDIYSVGHAKEDYVQSMRQPISHLRIGIPRAPFFDHLDEPTARSVEAAIAVLARFATIVDNVTLPSTSDFSSEALAVGFYAYHRKLFLNNPQLYSLQVRRELADLQAVYNNGVNESCGEKLADYVQLQMDLEHIRRVIDDEFNAFDLVVLPTTRYVPRTINDVLSGEEDPKPIEPEGKINTMPFNIWGLPSISIPCGFSKSGLPVGLMVCGPHFTEGRLLALSHAYESVTPWHTMRPRLTANSIVPPIIRRSVTGH